MTSPAIKIINPKGTVRLNDYKALKNFLPMGASVIALEWDKKQNNTWASQLWIWLGKIVLVHLGDGESHSHLDKCPGGHQDSFVS